MRQALQLPDPLERVVDGHRGDLVDVAAGDGDSQGFGAQPLAAAGRAGTHAHILFELVAHVVAGRFAQALLQVGDDAAVARFVVARLTAGGAVFDADFVLPARQAVEDEVALFGTELAHRHAVGDGVLAAEREQDLLIIAVLVVAVAVPPGANRCLGCCVLHPRSGPDRTPAANRGRCRWDRRRAGC